MDVSDASTADGATIIQWPYGGRDQPAVEPPAEHRRIVPAGQRQSGKLLQSPDSTLKGATLTQLTDDGGDNQWWSCPPGHQRLLPARQRPHRLVRRRHRRLHRRRRQRHPVAHHRRVEPGLAAHRAVTAHGRGAPRDGAPPAIRYFLNATGVSTIGLSDQPLDRGRFLAPAALAAMELMVAARFS